MSSLLLLLFTLTIILVVSFYTLFERKQLSSSHLRVGPNMVSWGGLLQPIADGVKLFLKELVFIKSSNYALYLVAPILTITTISLIASLPPMLLGCSSWSYFPLVLLLFTLFGLLPLLAVGWSSNNSWATIGVVRSVAQTVSYEVSIAFLLISWVWLNGSLSPNTQIWVVPLGVLVIPVSLMWVISILAESGRTPFDFAEAESELVSGFNVEYGGGWFACIFISEYGIMVLQCLLTGVILSHLAPATLTGTSAALCLLYFFIWVRCTLPRTRYDKLIGLSWWVILPSILMVLLWSVVV